MSFEINAARRLQIEAADYQMKLHKASDLLIRLSTIFKNQLSLNKVDATIGVKGVSLAPVLRALQRLGYTLNPRDGESEVRSLSLDGTPALQVQSPREDWDPVISFV